MHHSYLRWLPLFTHHITDNARFLNNINTKSDVPGSHSRQAASPLFLHTHTHTRTVEQCGSEVTGYHSTAFFHKSLGIKLTATSIFTLIQLQRRRPNIQARTVEVKLGRRLRIDVRGWHGAGMGLGLAWG